MSLASRPLAGETQALLYPGGGACYVQVRQPKPCITILVHGVNDLAGVYADIEKGLCQGLTERLDHLTNARGQVNSAALVPATYSLPSQDDHLAPDPDAVYYRRLANNGKPGHGTRSVVIPFYWGFREDGGFDPKTKKDYIQKDTPHGEWLDRYGNRLDKAGTKEGGAFANATTTLPDMWGQGFSGVLFGVVPMNTLAGTPGHPLMPAPSRNYMVLGAKRLAMLVSIIRAKHPDDTINVVAHSQGTMLTLLANAFLKDAGQRPIDSAVMMNSPYSLEEPIGERIQAVGKQQTKAARKETLQKIVAFIGDRPHHTPTLAQMADPAHVGCIGGLRWTGAQCATTFEQAEHVFDERDNRGNVLLYFTPQDQTVGLRNVQGIGWQGVPSALVGELGNRFYQRIFTLRERNAQPEEVGTPPHAYVMREAGESTWDGNGQGWFGNATRSELDKGQVAVVNAPPLPRAFRPNFHGEGNVVSTTGGKDGIHMVKSRMDPIDASIAITNGGWKPGVYMSYDLDKNDPVFAQGYHKDAVQAAINAGRAPFDQTQIKHVVLWDEGTVRVVRTESPSDARQRLMEIPDEQLTKADALSFHSAIPANPDHSRYAVAYDLAIGQAKSLDDEAFYTYLCRVADWRLGWGERKKDDSFYSEADGEKDGDTPDDDTLAFYQAEAAAHRQLIDATADYHANGKPQAYPAYFQPPLPSLVRSETRV